jgi:putative transposase
MAEGAEDFKAIKVRCEKRVQTFAEEFVSLYGKRFPKTISIFEASMGDTLSYLRYPGSHHARRRSTSLLQGALKEVKGRTRVVGSFPDETSGQPLALRRQS